jgi:predicted RNA methylase
VAVYLTDAKRVDPPAPSAPEPAPQIETLPPEPSTPPAPQAADPAAEGFAALKATLKAGVKVAVAPQLFPTPPELAVRMVALAGIEAGDRVIEPSAGTGNLARAIRSAVPDAHLDLIEIDPELCSILKASGFEVSCRDFLAASMPVCPDSEDGHDCVLMNPPFSKGQDVVHILHALKFLKPGGRLVAICANGPRQQAELRPLATNWEELPEGTFAEQGTNVRAALMTVQR